MHHLERKPFDFFGWSHAALIRQTTRNDRDRQQFACSVFPLLHRSEKFIFDSGSDQDTETVMAVRETAVEMMERGLFHLPHPITYVEDHFSDEDFIGHFYAYLCIESANVITIHPFLSQIALFGGSEYAALEAPLRINLSKPSDNFDFAATLARNPFAWKLSGEIVYSLKKFIVTLATEQEVREPVAGRATKPSLPKQFRSYAHTIVRVPVDTLELWPDIIGIAAGTTDQPTRALAG